MARKVKAVEKKIKFDKNPENPGVWRYVMSPELYTALTAFLTAITTTSCMGHGPF